MATTVAKVWARWMSVLLLLTPVAMASTAPSVTEAFNRFWQSARGKPYVEQVRLWDELIERPRAELYASVVWDSANHPDWRAQKARWLGARFAAYADLAAAIPAQADALRAALDQQQPRFRQWFPDASAHPPIVFVLAPNFDAKSGVLADGTPVLAFAVDSLLMEKARLDIVVPHELFHLYHAQHAGIRNDGVMPAADLTLPLFEEGLATYVSGQLSAGHTDAELLLQDDLGDISTDRLAEMAGRFLADACFKAIDPAHPEAYRRWFSTAAQRYQKDLPNRSGYWLGLQVIRQLRRDYSLATIASWSPQAAQGHSFEALQLLSQHAESCRHSQP
ncbi:hypothetical protein [Dyella silvatica]|uniref:hypothetical protein n=1 Tax=Dyella silvatica TaxID=2992128 RepID=UPI00225073BB|nr:hypothetical protein [Dyella silvatica]